MPSRSSKLPAPANMMFLFDIRGSVPEEYESKLIRIMSLRGAMKWRRSNLQIDEEIASLGRAPSSQRHVHRGGRLKDELQIPHTHTLLFGYAFSRPYILYIHPSTRIHFD